MNGDTPLWEAISSKHDSIFKLLHHYASLSNPKISGDLLCQAAKRNDLSIMKELLKHGLDVDSINCQGLRALQVAIAENHVEMVNFLVISGASVEETLSNMVDPDKKGFPPELIEEVASTLEFGHKIVIPEMNDEHKPPKEQIKLPTFAINSHACPRISIYKGHPTLRNGSSESGKLIRLPRSLEELKDIAGLFLIHILIPRPETAEVNVYNFLHLYFILVIHEQERSLVLIQTMPLC